jgi:hypothetical protein
MPYLRLFLGSGVFLRLSADLYGAREVLADLYGARNASSCQCSCARCRGRMLLKK